MSRYGLKYTATELAFIRDNCDKMTDAELAKWLPGRTPEGIERKRIQFLGKKSNIFSLMEIAFLKENSGKFTLCEFSRRLKRSKSTIHKYCKRYAIEYRKYQRPTLEFSRDKAAAKMRRLRKKWREEP